jgi:hypothetical protein
MTQGEYMHKSITLLAIAFLVGLPLSLSADAYDKAVVVENMRANVARITLIKNAIAAEDFFAAGVAFFDYASEAAAIQKMDPPKGSKDQWVTLWANFQEKAFLGVGACGERDAEKSLKILNEIVALSGVGHPTFR